MASIAEEILIIYAGEHSVPAVDAGIVTAYARPGNVRVLQILDSDLYHYGHNDPVAPRLNKQRFLMYIRDEVLARGRQEAQTLRERAQRLGVAIEIDPVETDDLVATVVGEARKGYGMVFLAKEKRRLFPLLKKSLAGELRRRSQAQVVEC